jgi:hypothetical protein
MGFNKSELATIAKTSPDGFSVELRSAQDGFWYAFVMLTHAAGEHQIMTARGDFKSWRKLDDAVLFFEKTCPACQKFEVKIGTWILVKKV